MSNGNQVWQCKSCGDLIARNYGNWITNCPTCGSSGPANWDHISGEGNEQESFFSRSSSSNHYHDDSEGGFLEDIMVGTISFFIKCAAAIFLLMWLTGNI